MFRLQIETPFSYSTGQTKKNSYFALRWKDIAICEDFEELKKYAAQMNVKELRIVDNDLAVVWTKLKINPA